MVIPQHPYTNKEVVVQTFCFRTRSFVPRVATVVMGSETRLLVRLSDGEMRGVGAKDVLEVRA
jgi:hypothetical protein